jgi:hypothetical protein
VKKRIIYIIILSLLLMIATKILIPQETQLTEFQPAEGSLFKITFLYPKNWDWEVPPDWAKTFEDKWYGTIFVTDPYPTNDLKDGCKFISIHVSLRLPESRMQESIELTLKDITTMPDFELLNDREIRIDDRKAKWITYKKADRIGDRCMIRSAYVTEEIFLLANDRYYVFFLSISEDQANGRFHDEFMKMVESIRVLP